jgi:hypothetical protein
MECARGELRIIHARLLVDLLRQRKEEVNLRTVEPSYRRVPPEEARKYLRLRRNGRSVRWIARRYRRSHGTVAQCLARVDQRSER